ncbi:MAG: hypothetical protein LBB61_04915 [Treponema sp.]|nr:hypothetical protein [Treponema sp.]
MSNNNGFGLPAIDKKYMLELEKLSFIQRDSFDGALIAPAISEKMFLVTVDENIQKYPVTCIW